MPSAIAPLDTRTTSLVRVRSCAICAAQRAIAALSRPWPWLVTSELPTLPTRRRADLSSRAMSGRLFIRQMIHDGETHLAAALAGERRDREPPAFPAIRLEEALHRLVTPVRLQHVGLVEYQPPRFLVQRLIVFLQLVDDRARVLDRIHAVVEGRDVDQVQQQPRARQVAQELVTQSGALCRTLDQAGDVGDDETPVLGQIGR